MKGAKGRTADQYDSPWKEALEVYLRPMLELCFPQVAEAIDWTSGQEFLDKELEEIARGSALGSQRVDKLVKVKLKDGVQEWILMHIEVQHQPRTSLPQRVYQYHHRARDRFGQRVLSLVILADGRPNWRPSCYEEGVLGCRVRFDFPVCKLLDLTQTAQSGVEARQPSAVIVLANWLAQRTRRDMAARGEGKWELTRRLYEAGFGREDIAELYRLIDWLLRLPEAMERGHRQRLRSYEEQKRMPYVTSIERMAREEGRVEGQCQLLLMQLGERLGTLAPELERRVRGLSVQQLESLARALLGFTTLSDLQSWLQRQDIPSGS